MTSDLFLELAWKSGLVAGAALVAASLMRRRPAAERVAVLRLGVGLVLALPLLMAVLPVMHVEPWPAPIIQAQNVADAPSVAPVAVGLEIPGAAPPSAIDAPRNTGGLSLDVSTGLLGLYGLGWLVLMLRLTAGVLTLHRWTRQAEPVTDPAWLAALERAARGRRARPMLAVSPRVLSPLSWGWRPPVILLNPGVLARPDQAPAVLGHEMGHVRRGDWLFLILSRGLVAVFWFNPLIWLLQRELSRQSEQAADAYAVRGMARVDYADALVTLARRDQPHAALGMSGSAGDLARRVTAVLAPSPRAVGSWLTGLCVAVCVGVTTPLAALDLGAATPDRDDRPVRASQLTPSAGPDSTGDRPAPLEAERSRSLVRGEATGGSGQTAERQAQIRAQVQQAERQRQQAMVQYEAGLRQRRNGMAQMQNGLAEMEQAIVELRRAADDPRLTAQERASLRADVEELERDARELRGEAEALALEITSAEGDRQFIVTTDVSTGVRIEADEIQYRDDGSRAKFKLKGDARIEADEIHFTPAPAGSSTLPEPVPIPSPTPTPGPSPRPLPSP